MPTQDPTSDASARDWNEARLLSIIDSAMDAIVTVDESQRVVMFNKAAERVFGVPAGEAVGSPLDRFIPARHRKGHAEHVRSFGTTGVTMRQMGRLGTLHGLRTDGSEFPIEASISHSAFDGRRLYTVILRDVSEHKRLQEQLLHAQKMEVIGRLAGGIAHDFNNLLMAIFNYLTLATKALEPEHPSRAALAQVHEASNRAAALTRQLLTFARKQVVHPRVISLRDVVAGLEPMLRRLITDDIALRTVLSADPSRVLADPTQLEQVLMNLVVNARDAMPSGGTITIEVAESVLDEAYCQSRVGVSLGPGAVLCVTDTGVGMSPEVQARIFEPFFTTKEPGKGTGLGLATCHGIVTQCGGDISVRSAPGRGTTIRIILPLATDPIGDDPSKQTPTPAARGNETILLAEDSGVVRELIANGLRLAGYTVLAASDGMEAMKLSKEHMGRIDLLITDMVMPGMSGIELAQALAAQRERASVLYISGGGEDALKLHGTNPHRAAVLPKPFTIEVLLGKIRSILDHKRA
jgi:two-component system, cell cycle sensor histidine kinase and response regulator CckA